MKKLFSLSFMLLVFSLVFISWSTEEINYSQNEDFNLKLIEQQEVNSRLIETFDYMIRSGIENPYLTDEELGEIFLTRAAELDLIISTPENQDFSEEFLYYGSILGDTSGFEDGQDYIDSIIGIQSEIEENPFLSNEEKERLLEGILFLVEFEEWQSSISYEYGLTARSWWNNWGRCVVGTIGSTIGGTTMGFLGGAAAGTVVLPVIGTVSGATVGAVGGAAAGALTGAATFC